MDTVMKTGKNIVLDDFSRPKNAGETDVWLSDQLVAMLGEETGLRHEIPSLMAMANYFNCSNLGVYDALRQLKSKGYEYYLRGIDNPIQIWMKNSQNGL